MAQEKGLLAFILHYGNNPEAAASTTLAQAMDHFGLDHDERDAVEKNDWNKIRDQLRKTHGGNFSMLPWIVLWSEPSSYE